MIKLELLGKALWAVIVLIVKGIALLLVLGVLLVLLVIVREVAWAVHEDTVKRMEDKQKQEEEKAKGEE